MRVYLGCTAGEHLSVVSAPGQMSHMIWVPPQDMLHLGLPIS